MLHRANAGRHARVRYGEKRRLKEELRKQQLRQTATQNQNGLRAWNKATVDEWEKRIQEKTRPHKDTPNVERAASQIINTPEEALTKKLTSKQSKVIGSKGPSNTTATWFIVLFILAVFLMLISPIVGIFFILLLLLFIPIILVLKWAGDYQKGQQAQQQQRLRVKQEVLREQQHFKKQLDTIPALTIQRPNEPAQLIAKPVRAHVIRRDNGCCVNCGEADNLVFEHSIPISQGGSNTPDNVRLMCQDCIDERQRTAAARMAALRKQTAQRYTPSERNIPPEVKQAVYARDGGRCVMCGATKNLHYDHDIPFSKGGGNTAENIQLLCRECNLKKGSKIR
ncbi:MAG: HNH endonuclease [Halobacteriota archaeon]